MAKLYRCVKLNDRFDTQVFTFILPKTLIREFSPDIFSTEIVYGYHKWNVSFMKSERHLGAFLKLLTTSANMSCWLDYSFTMLNRDHFTRNESFLEKNCYFTLEEPVRGRKTFVGLLDLSQRSFMHDSGEFLVELEIRNVLSTFECFLKLTKESQLKQGYSEKLETPYFSFGLFDWSVSLCTPSGGQYVDKTAVQLYRHTSFDHLCNIRYQVTLGEGMQFESGPFDQTLDASGIGDPFIVTASLQEMAQRRTRIKLKVDMYSVVSVSEVALHVLTKSRNRAHCYDRDKQAWMLEGDASGKFLAFRLYYTDISHVPRKFTRFVCWNVSVVPAAGGKAVKALDGPFSKYYVQQDLDEGFVMHTNIPVDIIQEEENIYLDSEDKKLTVHIEWIGSYLLVRPTYHRLDDVTRVHKHQMWREIMALQAENYALEKQLHSYQLSIAKTNLKIPINEESQQGPEWQEEGSQFRCDGYEYNIIPQ